MCLNPARFARGFARGVPLRDGDPRVRSQRYLAGPGLFARPRRASYNRATTPHGGPGQDSEDAGPTCRDTARGASLPPDRRRMSDEQAIRRAIVAACREMNGLGINQGTSGNISVRFGGGLLITPSGVPYERMAPDDIVLLAMDGSFDHALRPSSEWRFHRDIMAARPDVGAIVHVHPIYATAFAICGREIPAVHYMIAAAGGPTIRCGGYATYGTEELSQIALTALQDRSCCLLANHGLIATGSNLEKAMWLAVEVETLCRQYAVALQIGDPRVLPDDEIARVVEKFKSYGLNAGPKSG
jgi:L-fuculose-phosphate aldolase